MFSPNTTESPSSWTGLFPRFSAVQSGDFKGDFEEDVPRTRPPDLANSFEWKIFDHQLTFPVDLVSFLLSTSQGECSLDAGCVSQEDDLDGMV